MLRSMYSGVSGLRVHQTKMDVIANNISNVNTTGFKSSRVTFNEVFSQTLSSAGGPNPQVGRGGTNPMQIGLGSNVSSVDKIMTVGAAQRTDNPFDLMIQGDGFFVVGDNNGQYFTRAGALKLDLDGNLVNASGLKVYGWDVVSDPANPGENKIQKAKVKPIQISGEKEYITPKTTTNISFAGNLNAVADGADGVERTMSFYDSLGNRYVADIKFVYNSTNKAWEYRLMNEVYVNGDTSTNPLYLSLTTGTTPNMTNSQGLVSLTLSSAPAALASVTIGQSVFGTNGLIASGANSISSLKIQITQSPALTPPPPGTNNGATNPMATFGKTEADGKQYIYMDFRGMTQFGNETSTVKVNKYDGNGPGRLNGISVDSNGKIMGRYSNGLLKLLGQIPVANFKNPAGLEKVGDNLFVPTGNSGEFDGVGDEIQASGGKLLGGVLEMSNVDLSSEFTELITTQRGFQANSRIISTSDDILQELVNLKR